ncbi:peptide chain release factor N(5)-glutamine methyltransferase [Roseovarius salinarum]|uniref:peptide chain release factor N(5)-glutamine methyltransferase n=1 Tax=Roseovarius salinarum TaxID=1981892 RepID=UPI000C34BAB5|nr:peptide chain release factor N(5)-glutamine methyltransferase [Roseovarius salinarum]
MTLREALAAGTRRLTEAGAEAPARAARALLAEAAGIAADRLVPEAGSPLPDAARAAYDGYLDRHAAGEPVARILGRRVFWGRDFAISPDVLDPRAETETLVARALDGPAPTRLLDLGTGSGVLAVTLLAEWPEACAVATDVSRAALAVAGRNARAHGVADRLHLLASDWFGSVSGRFDLVVANPPYVTAAEMAELPRAVAGHDPHGALTPGGDGLSAYRAIAADAPGHLAAGGRLLVEIGWRQGADVAAIFRAAGLRDVAVHADMAGRDRVVSACSAAAGA